MVNILTRRQVGQHSVQQYERIYPESTALYMKVVRNGTIKMSITNRMVSGLDLYRQYTVPVVINASVKNETVNWAITKGSIH
jgi:hypothetical protein